MWQLQVLNRWQHYPVCWPPQVVYTVATSVLSGAADAAESGTVIALSHSTRSVVGLFGLVLGGTGFHSFCLQAGRGLR